MPPNRLAGETSPYLLQHAHDPVDWYPWGPEALERARAEKRPIFLSVGYSACHWCHVMARESFADARIARLLNEHFVSIKVDREERPDIDEVYMRAVQSLTGAGGWPMSVFLTPEREPFYAGTYFPPYAFQGMPGFTDVLRRLADAWRRQPEGLVERARGLARRIAEEAAVDTRGRLAPDVLDRSLAALQRSADPLWGGFGDAPKFPHAADLRLLLRHGLRTGRHPVTELALHSLERMARGGIHDRLGGGFHRYSTDERWQVPHFEKMLYDTALLVPAYLEGHLVAPGRGFDAVAREACAWALREMRTPEGAFAASQDADSEGEEGRFFTWTPDELARVLGRERGARAQELYDVEDEGSVAGDRSVLWRPHPDDEVARTLGTDAAGLEAFDREARSELFRARETRPRPATDDKVLAGWNGLMVSALAGCYQVLGERACLDAARTAARFVLEAMRDADGGLCATSRGGSVRHAGLLEDHAYCAQAALDLYESDFDPAWLTRAVELADVVEERFADPVRGGCFATGADHEPLLARLRTIHDGALPSGNGVHALSLLRLAELTGERRFAERAEAAITGFGAMAERYPAAVSQLLCAVDFLAATPREIVIAGEPDAPAVEALLGVVRRRFLPQRVVALAHPGADTERVPILEGKQAPVGGARAYVCRAWTCGAALESPTALDAALDD